MRLHKQMEIAKEYNLAFSLVVKGFADAGESMTATAKILDYCPGAFRRLMIRRGWKEWFKPATKTNGWIAAAKSRTRSRDLAAAMAANPRYRWVVINDIRDTIRGHARRLGIPDGTVRNRLAAGLSVEEALDVRSRVKSPDNAGHFWRARL